MMAFHGMLLFFSFSFFHDETMLAANGFQRTHTSARARVLAHIHTHTLIKQQIWKPKMTKRKNITLKTILKTSSPNHKHKHTRAHAHSLIVCFCFFIYLYVYIDSNSGFALALCYDFRARGSGESV